MPLSTLRVKSAGAAQTSLTQTDFSLAMPKVRKHLTLGKYIFSMLVTPYLPIRQMIQIRPRKLELP